MEDYNFWRDFFDTYQSLSDLMKFAWLLVVPVFMLGFIALFMRYRLAVRKVQQPLSGDLVYSIVRDEQNLLHVYRHHPEIDKIPDIILLDHASRTG